MVQLLKNMPMLGFDTETTGVDVFEDRVVTCNITYSYPDGSKQVFNWLINPGVEIPTGASDVHGITTEYAREHGGDPREILTIIAQHLGLWISQGLPLVAYNAAYDCTILIYEFARYGIEFPYEFVNVVDPMVMWKGLDKNPYKKRTLTAAADQFGVVLDNAHSADADSMAAIEVARKMGEMYEIDVPLSEIHDQQVKWKKEQAADLQAYFRKKKKDDTIIINGDWPIQRKENIV